MNTPLRKLALAVLLMSGGCGGGSGDSPDNGVNVAPTISNFLVSPSTVEQNDNGGQVEVFGSFDFSEPNGNLNSVTFTVFDAAGNTVQMDTDIVPGADGVKLGRIEGSAMVSSADVTFFTLEVFLTDKPGLQSNRLEETFRVRPITWTGKTAMPSPRLEFATATINDMIYVIGGRDDTSGTTPRPPVAVVEIYDPANDSWTTGPSLPEPIARSSAVEVNGRIYLIGGVPEILPQTKSVYEFDPATQSWATKASLPMDRVAAAAAAYGGQIFVAGGREGGMQYDSLLRYDVASNQWSAGAPMTYAREGAAAAVINGTLYVYGGRSTTFPQDAGYGRVIEAYDPVLDLWVERAPGDPRQNMGAAAINGMIYTFGGNNVARALDTVQLYDSVSDSWSGDKPLPIPVAYARAEVVGDRIYIFGTSETFEYAP